MLRILLILITLLPGLGLATTIHDDAYLEAACEGRWPGRFVEVSAKDSYDCETGELVLTADPFGCEDSTLEECYEDA